MEIGIALIIGLGIGLMLYAANSNSFSQAQKVSIYITIIFIPLQLLLFIIYLIYNSQQKEEPAKVHSNQKAHKEINVFDDRINLLKELKDSGILTEEEYSEKSKNIENSKLDSELKESNNYKKLKSLFDDGVLTKEEFENKVEILKESIENVDYKLHKAREGWSINLGKYIEYTIKFKNGGEYNNVYQSLNEEGYFIKRNYVLLSFKTIEDLIVFIKK